MICRLVAGALFASLSAAAQGSALPAPVVAPLVRYFGFACGPASPEGMPTISVNFEPRIGQGLWLRLFGTWGYLGLGDCKHRGQAFLLVGSSNQSWGGVPLPFVIPLAMTWGYACLAHVSGEVLLQVSGPLASQGSSEAASTSFMIPNLPALVGQRLYLQWLVQRWQVGINCPHPWPYFYTSNAAEITIGY